MRSLIAFVVLTVVLLASTALPQPQGLEMRIFTVRASNAQSISNVARNLKSPEGSVTFDPNTNSLIVVDYPQNLQRIASLVEQLDKTQKQVEIKVTVADVTNNFLSNIGMHSGQVIIPTGEFNAVLRMLDTDKSSSIRSQMTVRTISNQPAQLMVSKDEIIGKQITRYENGDEVTTVIRKPIGDFLEVLPSVNNDGTIMIILRPTMSTLERRHTPYERSIITQVLINNGDTIALGGLDSAQQRTEDRSVSVLGIPLYKKTETESKKIVMFLTANIID